MSIDPAVEEHVVRRALEEGLLTPQELDDHSAELGRWGPRLASLLRGGLLTPAIARRFADEAAEQTGPRGSGLPVQRRAEERFELGELIGQGGMGKVYRAYDRSLRRPVALKFIHGEDPDHVRRFLAEAQAQARIDHQRVCKVYEVGELDGRPYIAMQLIAGQPLFVSDAARGTASPSPLLNEMTVDQKVRLMQMVAEGIHAAHREGLIHRDVKPSNILVERTPDGALAPYVLDFGLAREVASTGVTSLGLAAGTPNFMAPEQAHGLAALDRRTDVYGLGATLYAILAGRPPFEGYSSLDVLVKVTEQELPRLEGIPEDVQTIVSKALQKDPALRYESARALADDLGRYLDGDPILARKTSLRYRLLKKARKHRKVVAASAVAAAAFVALAAASVRAQLEARERTRLAGLFGQEVKAVESRMRIAHMTPEHDISPAKKAIRTRMEALEGQLGRLGRVAQGPGHYALGRGHLALGEPADAREHLEKSWSGGYREKDVAYALGRALGALYQKELDAAKRIPDKERREARTRELQREYRDPALDYLRKSEGLEVESPEYVQALMAFYEERYDEALRQAEAAHRRAPWLYEAQELVGRVHTALMTERLDDRGQALAAYGLARAAYQAALRTARSNPRVPEGMCFLDAAAMQRELYAGGSDVEPYFRQGVEACDQALRIDPESADAYRFKALLYWRMGETRWRRGDDPRDMLDRAQEASRRALRLDPKDASAYASITMALLYRSVYDQGHGLDSTKALREAIRVADDGLRAHPNEGAIHNARANCYTLLATEAMSRGRDPREPLERAQAGYRDTVAVGTKWLQSIALANLSDAHRHQASFDLDRGKDPRADLGRALEAAEKALQVNPRHILAHHSVAQVHLEWASYQTALGEDPSGRLEKAAAGFRGALAINGNDRVALNGVVLVHAMRAEWALAAGLPMAELIEEGGRAVRKVREVHPDNPGGLMPTARFALAEARWAFARGLSPEEALARCRAVVERELGENARNAAPHVMMGEMQGALASWHRRQGRPSRADVERGLASLDQALAINPTHARALAVRAALYAEQAQADAPARALLLLKAREALDRAVAINPLLAREYADLRGQVGGEALRAAAGRGARPLAAIAEGGAVR